MAVKSKKTKVSLQQKIYNTLIKMQVQFKYVQKQTRANTESIQTLNENQHSFVTKEQCEKCKAGSEKNVIREEDRRQIFAGRRQGDRNASRQFISYMVVSILLIVIAILNYIK